MSKSTPHINPKSTKKGAASFYVVIFTTLVLSVVTLSFIRLMISETSQTSGSDLSQSAYDSALGGIEDAKAALARYESCRTSGATGCYSPTVDYNSFQQNLVNDDFNSSNCNQVGGTLYNSSGEEVALPQDTNDDANQAYTCVILKTNLPDYRKELSGDQRVAVVKLDPQVSYIKLRWYDKANDNTNNYKNVQNGKAVGQFADIGGAVEPPVISAQVVTADVNLGLLVLQPTGDRTNDADTSRDVGIGDGTKNLSENTSNSAKDLQCNLNLDWACGVKITGLGAGTGDKYLVISLPYGGSKTSFDLRQYNSSDQQLYFGNAQIAVDSTGRAGDHYRRVESRLETMDNSFPFPEYAVSLSGDGDNSKLEKSFYVTTNCWKTEHETSGTFGVAGCSNSGTI